MNLENGEAIAGGEEKTGNRQGSAEKIGQAAGQAWIDANPGIVRTVLASYLHFGETVMMSRDEFRTAKKRAN